MVSIMVLVIVGLIFLALIGYALITKREKRKKTDILPMLATIFAIWGLCTSWLWFYLFNLYISLPAILLAILLNGIAAYKGLTTRLVKINAILILIAFALGAVSFVYFDM